MSATLSEALQDVELEAGRTYRFEVKGRWVELRVLAEEAEPRLDPWVEFPPPAAQFRLRAKPGKLSPPDPPDIPRDGEFA